MERLTYFVTGGILLVPVPCALVSNSTIVVGFGLAYVVAISTIIPRRFWRRFWWACARVNRLLLP